MAGGKITLSLNVSATRANIRSQLDGIINGLKPKVTLDVKIKNKSEIQKMVKDVERLNSLMRKTSTTSSKGIGNKLASNWGSSINTFKKAESAMTRLQNRADKLGYSIKKADLNKYFKAMNERDLKGAINAMRGVHSQVTALEKSAKSAFADTTIGNNARLLLNKVSQLGQTSEKTANQARVLKMALSTFENADNSVQRRVSAYRQLQQVMKELASSYKLDNAMYGSKSGASPQLQKIEETKRAVSELKKLYGELRSTTAGANFSSAFSNVEKLFQTDTSKMNVGQLKRFNAELKSAMADLKTAEKSYNLETKELGGIDTQLNKIQQLKKTVAEIKAVYSDLRQTTAGANLSSAIGGVDKLLGMDTSKMNAAQLKSFASQVKSGIADINSAMKSYNAESKGLSKLEGQLSKIGSAVSKIDSLRASAKGRVAESNGLFSFDKGLDRQIDSLISKYNRLDNTISRVKSGESIQGFDLKKAEADAKSLEQAIKNVYDVSRGKKQNGFNEFDAEIRKATADVERLGREWSAIFSNSQMRGQYKDLRNMAQNIYSKEDLAKYRKEMGAFQAQVKNAGLNTMSLGDQFKKTFKNFAMFFGASRIIYEGVAAVKSMISNVTQLDSAMVELRKVSDETDSQYDAYFQRSKQSAVEIGTTVHELINSTADFARLGYNLGDAENLAKVATIYQRVGDDIDSVDVATQSIISTMKAFDIPANDAITIVDKFNEVGRRNCPVA